MSLPARLPAPGPLLRYHTWLHQMDPAKAEWALLEIRRILKEPGGVILLDMLAKSVALTPSEILGDERALAARNAQAFILTDLQRIASDEYERILAAKDDAANARRGNPRRDSGS